MPEPTQSPLIAQGAVVVYPVGELLAGIRNDMNTSFARLEKGLEGKADKSDFARLNGRLDEHQAAIADLKRRQGDNDITQTVRGAARAASIDWHRWLYPTLATVVLAIITILQVAGVFR